MKRSRWPRAVRRALQRGLALQWVRSFISRETGAPVLSVLQYNGEWLAFTAKNTYQLPLDAMNSYTGRGRTQYEKAARVYDIQGEVFKGSLLVSVMDGRR